MVLPVAIVWVEQLAKYVRRDCNAVTTSFVIISLYCLCLITLFSKQKCKSNLNSKSWWRHLILFLINNPDFLSANFKWKINKVGILILFWKRTSYIRLNCLVTLVSKIFVHSLKIQCGLIAGSFRVSLVIGFWFLKTWRMSWHFIISKLLAAVFGKNLFAQNTVMMSLF